MSPAADRVVRHLGLLVLVVALVVVVVDVAGRSSSSPAPARRGQTTPSPAAGSKLVVGIGDQQAAMFGDPRFRALGIDRARLVVSYDTTSVLFERQLVDTWLAAARRAGVEPFITFQHSRVNPGRLPTVAEFRDAFLAFRARYPQVRVYAAWNEINNAAQPTYDHPERAAEYYDVVRANCPGCVVVAGDVLDAPGMAGYLARYRRHLSSAPQIWGLHNYTDVNRFRDGGLRAMLAAVPGQIWLTETGGVVQLAGRLPRDEQRAARATAFALRLARAHPRVARLYLYNWTGTDPGARFDSGLIAPDGTARPAYGVLKAALSSG